jgi:hypothetical protein
MGIWERVNGSNLNQGDRLDAIAVPLIRDAFPALDQDGNVPLDVQTLDVIILTQSCDLETEKVSSVVVAAIFSVEKFEGVDPSFRNSGKWKDVSRGRIEGLHLLHGHNEPANGRECVVVDFRQIISLPINYVQTFAGNNGERWRLCPPYLESMSQAFGRYFMRVALPIDLPRNFAKP